MSSNVGTDGARESVRIEANVQRRSAPLAFFFLVLYTISVLIRPHEFSLETAEYQFIRVFALSAFFLTLISYRPLKPTPHVLYLIGLLPLIMISAFLNGWGTGGFDQAERLLVASLVPFFLFSTLADTEKRINVLFLIGLVAALVMVGNGIVQQRNFNGNFGIGIGNSITVAGEEMRISYLGFFSDPNDLGMFIVMNVPIALYFYVRGGILQKSITLVVTAALFYGIYITGSRGTLVAATAVVGTYFLVRSANFKLILFSAVCAPFLMTLISTFGGLGGDGSVEGRLDAWYEGIRFLVANPIFGIGMGNFMEEHGKVAHNSYIHVAAELGVIGYFLWIIPLTMNMLAAFDMIKNPPVATSEEHNRKSELTTFLIMNQAVFLSMIGFMVAAFFLSRQTVLTLFIYLGIQTVILRRIQDLSRQPNRYWTKDGLKTVLLTGGVTLISVYIAVKVGLS